MPSDDCRTANFGKSGIEEFLPVFRDESLRLGILEDGFVSLVLFKVFYEFFGVPFRHAEIVHKVVSAILRRGSGDFFRFFHRFERVQDQPVQFLRRAVALQDEIKTRQAPHWPPIDDIVFPRGIVP